MKLGELIKSLGYTIDNDLDYNLIQFVLNLDLKLDRANTEYIDNKESKKENIKHVYEIRKPNKTFLDKLSKHKRGDAERGFILNILENNLKYESYKHIYLEWMNINIKDYTNEKIQLLSEILDIDIYNMTDGEISEYDIVSIIEGIENMIDIFKEKVLPPVALNVVYEEFSNFVYDIEKQIIDDYKKACTYSRNF